MENNNHPRKVIAKRHNEYVLVIIQILATSYLEEKIPKVFIYLIKLLLTRYHGETRNPIGEKQKYKKKHLL